MVLATKGKLLKWFAICRNGVLTVPSDPSIKVFILKVLADTNIGFVDLDDTHVFVLSLDPIIISKIQTKMDEMGDSNTYQPPNKEIP